MNLRALDLNLLVVLDALLDESHVTRAADRLGLSQPATSSALDRCRHLFGDPLLERVRGGMRLTPRGQALRDPLKALLAQVSGLVEPVSPDLSQVRRTLRLSMGDYPAVLVAHELRRRLQVSAPGIDLVILPWRGGADATESLRRGLTDLAISVLPSLDDDFRRRDLMAETYVVAMRPDHPAAAAFDLKAWLAWPHLLVSGRGETRSPLDDMLEAQGLHRRVGLVVPSFIMAQALLQDSDLIAMAPSRVARDRRDMAVFPPPIPVEGFTLHMGWHRRADGDPVVQHVAGLIQQILG
ncbi:LysR family transcriptional regulator [Phenylobacterium aquaticum]|uniref:LysR family transcriptional regulator n=1 Tax=Phenylobacterium aquaticum TaxID=1763816 RepID=UPI001F5C9E73|nr:LysR family transcriptional regulator [Phenylobacterium aquaticum]MCI3134935.1 LysR family transcriptional regulator [Phenylobacterium aquaticum]